MTNIAEQSTVLYIDMPVERLIMREVNGFVHPVSGDMLAKLRAQR